MADNSFEGLANLRDLGGTETADGRTVRAGMLLRSDQLAHATPSDIARLDTMGIMEVIDFRSSRERGERPDCDIAGASNLHLPVFDDIAEGITRDEESDKIVFKVILESAEAGTGIIDERMQGMYREFVASPFAVSQYTRFVGEVLRCAEAGRAVLWHCTAGKDRAGFATAIVLETLGVGRDAIFEDYLLTNGRLATMTENLIDHFASFFTTEAMRTAARRFFSADESYLGAAYAAAEERYGSFAAFLEQGLGIDAAKRDRFKELLLL